MTNTITARAEHGGGAGAQPRDRESRETARVRRARRVAAGRAGIGMFCLANPTRALVPSQRASSAARRVMRILGARHLAQAAIEAAHPSPTVLRVGAGVDAVHALTCLGFGVLGAPRWRHGALLNAVSALGFCAVTAATARTHRLDLPTCDPCTQHRRRSDRSQGAHA
jgi:hypothetical protein